MSYHVCWPSVCRISRVKHSQLPWSRYEYLWEDGVKYKRPTKLPAPEYVDALMNWAQNLLDDENVFPNKIGLTLAIASASRPHGISFRCTIPQELP